MRVPTGFRYNAASASASRYLRNAARDLQRSIGRLSSGLRVRSASDDPAGMGVSVQLDSFVRSSRMARRNASEAIGMLHTTEGGLAAILEAMQRMRELSVQAANASMTKGDRLYLNTEFQGLSDEIDRIVAVTEYNGIQLLTGTAKFNPPVRRFQVGVRKSKNDQIQSDISLVSIFKNFELAKINGVFNVLVAKNAAINISRMDTVMAFVHTERAKIGSTINRLTIAEDTLSASIANTEAALSQTRDVDFAREAAEFARLQIRSQAAASLLAQANALPQALLRLLS